MRNTCSWKEWVICGPGALATLDNDGLREGEWEQREGFGLNDGERDGERSWATGEAGRCGGAGE